MELGEHTVLSIEVFAAKGPSGDPSLFMAVSRECGLGDGDTLLLEGRRMVAMRGRTVLPIDFPLLDESGRDKLVAWGAAGKRLPVAEFAARGLSDAYFLDLVVAS